MIGEAFTIHDVQRAGYTLEPMVCLHCKTIGETEYNQGLGDAFCAFCGKWQLEKEEDYLE